MRVYCGGDIGERLGAGEPVRLTGEAARNVSSSRLTVALTVRLMAEGSPVQAGQNVKNAPWMVLPRVDSRPGSFSRHDVSDIYRRRFCLSVVV